MALGSSPLGEVIQGLEEQVLTEELQNLRTWKGAWKPPAVALFNHTGRYQGSGPPLPTPLPCPAALEGEPESRASHSANPNFSLLRACTIQG